MNRRIMSISLIFLLVVCGLFGMFGIISDNTTAESWEIEKVDWEGDVGESTSIALDNENHPHISYYDRTNTALKYTKWTGDSWEISTVDSESDVGQYTSLALDVNDYPHISYYDAANQDLKYAKWDGESWKITTLDSFGEVGGYSSIAVGNNGDVHISYYNGTIDLITRLDALKYAHWNGESWKIETIDYDADVGRFTSIALDGDGNPHISFIDCSNRLIKYTRWTGSSWDTKTIGPVNRQTENINDYGSGTSLALDSNDFAHIVYVEGIYHSLRYARWDGNDWIIENVSYVCQVLLHVSIALDSDDNPHITYFSRFENTIHYARWTGIKWDIVYVDNTGGFTNGGFNSLALDEEGYAHISYFDYFQDDLKYAKLVPSDESLEHVEMDENYGRLFIGPLRITTLVTIESPNVIIIRQNFTLTFREPDLDSYVIQNPGYEPWVPEFERESEESGSIELIRPEPDPEISFDPLEEESDQEIINEPEEEQTIEIIYLQSSEGFDKIEKSSYDEQSDSNPKFENQEPNTGYRLYFLITWGLNLILMTLLMIVLALACKWTNEKLNKD
jgi:hypothetical protein